MNLSTNLPSTVKLCLLILVAIFITACGFPQDDKKEDNSKPQTNTNNNTADLLKRVYVIIGYRLYGGPSTNLPKLIPCDNSSIIFKSTDNANNLTYFTKDKSSDELYTGAVLPANYIINGSCNDFSFESTIPKITNNATVTITMCMDAKTLQLNKDCAEIYIYQSSN